MTRTRPSPGIDLANVYRLLNDYDNAIAAYQMADQLDLGNAGPRTSELPDHAEETAAIS